LEDRSLANPFDKSLGVSNTNVISHAGHILTLVESSFPCEINKEIETLGVTDFNGKLKSPMTAHPKECPKTGQLHFFGYNFAPPYLTYNVLNAKGELIKSEDIDIPESSMMHDFAMTENWIIFMDLPVVFTPSWIGKTLPYMWSEHHQARFGVMPKGGSNKDVKWFNIKPCYIFHVANAYESNGEIAIEVCRYDNLWTKAPTDLLDDAYLYRYKIDLAKNKIQEEALDDISSEFPRIHPQLTGLKHRFCYTVTGGVAYFEEDENSLVKYDRNSGQKWIHNFGKGRISGECVFVPAQNGKSEDEGYLFTFVFNKATNRSDFVIIDASKPDSPAIATVSLPVRVPFGFHGNWIQDN
jgi:carotenoid cleavage dioxygenase